MAGPVWLTSRFAGVSPGHARIILAALIVLLLATLLALRAPDLSQGRSNATATQGGQTDVLLYDQIVSGVRAGGDYYAVTADALRQGDYPLRPFVTFRLPTLAVVEANLPARAVLAMLYALVAAVAAAWLIRLRRTFATAPPVIVAMILLAAGLVAFVQPDLILFHEVWAGLLIALSLALRSPGRWIESVAFGLAAMLVRETAALYVAVMFIAAVVDGERREAAGWFAATGVLFAAVVAHAHAAGLVTRATDLQSPGWSQMLGFGYYVRAMATSTALAGVPLWLAAPLVGLALFGWASWRDALAVRAVATFAIYALLLGLFGRADTFYWALMTAPALLIGLVFVPDGVRDLARAILGRRRITVTRVAR